MDTKRKLSLFLIPLFFLSIIPSVSGVSDDYFEKYQKWANEIYEYSVWMSAEYEKLKAENQILKDTIQELKTKILVDSEGQKQEYEKLKTEKESLSNKVQEIEAENIIIDSGDFKLTLEPARGYLKEYNTLKALLPEEIDYLNEKIKLPYDVSVVAELCGYSGAFWVYDDREIIICYELVDDFYDVFSPEYFDDLTQIEMEFAVNANIVGHLYHEVGHVVIDTWGVPITGNDEDVADQFAVFLTWWFYEDDEVVSDVLSKVGLFHVVQDLRYEQYQADVHSLDLQRYYNLACYIYGLDPEYNAYLVTDDILPLYRADTCEYEFNQLLYGFENTFDKYLYV